MKTRGMDKSRKKKKSNCASDRYPYLLLLVYLLAKAVDLQYLELPRIKFVLCTSLGP